MGSVRSIRQPAESEWEQLYRDERMSLVRVALLITGSPEMAEDAFHTAVERVRTRLESIDRPGAYLRTVVVNAARELAGRAARERGAGLAAELPHEMHVHLDTRQLEIWAAMRQITERRRTALILRYYVDLPVGEIAELLECQPGTVSSLLHRGLADLREELSDD